MTTLKGLKTVIEDDQPPVDINALTTDEKKELITADTVSILSNTTLTASEVAFTASKSLFINTTGIAALRLPIPPSELQITIQNQDANLAYTSTRAKKSSGNCVLADAAGKPLIGTQYFFGPSKDPLLTRLDIEEGVAQPIKTLSKWTSRHHIFLLPDNRSFNWAYRKEPGFGANGAKGTALVLTLGEKRLAALIRNEETRTPGSKSCSAGNGGELVLSDEVGGEDGINEDLVVATCLLMLKKEIDRRRTVQIMMIAGVAT